MSTYNPEAHSTAHLTNAGYTKFIEVGWVECCPGPGPFFFYFFEGNDGTGGSFTWGGFANGGQVPNPPGNGTSYDGRFWLQHFGSATQFHMYVDWNHDGTIDDTAGSPNMLFTSGVPRAETGRRGGTGTGASDHHFQLQYYSSGGSWLAWPDNGLPQDGISNWHWQRIGDTAYKVVKG